MVLLLLLLLRGRLPRRHVGDKYRSCGDEPTTSREWNDKSLTLRSVNGSDNTR